MSPTVAAGALVALERAGLVDASRARLTMLGLARAARLEATGGGALKIDLRHARDRDVRDGVEPLAASAVAGSVTPHSSMQSARQ